MAYLSFVTSCFSVHFSFEIQPKKYRLVDTDYRRRVTHPDVSFEMISELPSKLSPYVRDVMLELVGTLRVVSQTFCKLSNKKE